MGKRNWLLLAIGDRIQPIQIQKTMFKFAKESGAPSQDIYDFQPYNWGPCSFEIYDDLSALRSQGLAEAIPTPSGWSIYRLTESGWQEALKIRCNSDPTTLQRLDDARDWVLSRNFEQLLRDIYSEYPHYATQSMFNKV